MNNWHEQKIAELPKAKVELSVVTSLLNEEDNLNSFYERVIKAVQQLNISYEIVFVDDGSTDNSFNILKALAEKDQNVKVIRFPRNFGQHMAMTAGFRYCRGKRVLWIDSDLQENPEDLPKLMAKMDEGFDLVFGVRKERKDSFFKKLSAKIFFKTFSYFSKLQIPENICTLRLLSERLVNHTKILTEHSRFLTGLQVLHGFRQAEVEVDYLEREKGRSKYNLFKMLKLSLDAMLSFSKFPLRIATFLGIISSGICFLVSIYIAVRYLFVGIGINRVVLLNLLLYLMGSMLFVILGIIGEYLGRVYIELLNRPLYVIEEKINLD